MTAVNLAEKLRYLRKSRGMSQVELARRLGLKNNAFISHLERGTKRPSDALLRKIAQVFGYDFDSLRALAGPAPDSAAQGELSPAAGADLMARVQREVELMGERLSELIGGALPEFLWSREHRLIAESTSRAIWLLAPRIAHHGVEEDLLSVARLNLGRGVRYRYLLADTKEARIEAGRLLKRYQEPETAGGGERGAEGLSEAENLPEIAFVSREQFPFVLETALFDPLDEARIRGSLTPPGSGAPEWEIGLGREQALELARHFARLWDRVTATLPPVRAG